MTFSMDVSDDTGLEEIIKLGFRHENNAKGWFEKDGALFLCSYLGDTKVVEKFPAPVSAEIAAGIVRLWLDGQTYPKEPNIDGSVSKGFRVYNNGDGVLGESYNAFLAIEPCWIEYHK